MKNALESTGNRTGQMKERISKLKDRNIEMIQVEEERELRFLKSKEMLQEQSDSIRKATKRVMGIKEGEKRKKGAENIFKEIRAENFPNLGEELDIQVHKAKRASYYFNAQTLFKTHYIKTVKSQ